MPSMSLESTSGEIRTPLELQLKLLGKSVIGAGELEVGVGLEVEVGEVVPLVVGVGVGVEVADPATHCE